MTDTPIHDMSRAIGALQSTVKNLTDNWQQQDREATEGRRLLHAKVDGLTVQQAVLTGQVAQQTAELAEVKPAIKRFEADRQRREGANSMVKLIWVGLTAFVAGLGYVAHDLIMLFWPPKH